MQDCRLFNPGNLSYTCLFILYLYLTEYPDDLPNVKGQ